MRVRPGTQVILETQPPEERRYRWAVHPIARPSSTGPQMWEFRYGAEACLLLTAGIG